MKEFAGFEVGQKWKVVDVVVDYSCSVGDVLEVDEIDSDGDAYTKYGILLVPEDVTEGYVELVSEDGEQNTLQSTKQLQWDEATRGPRMSGTTGNRIWKYQMPVAEQFEMKLPKGAEIIRMAGENGYLWLWAVVDTSAPDEVRKFEAFKAGGTMPDDLTNHVFRGMAHIYIQQELMLYIFEVMK